MPLISAAASLTLDTAVLIVFGLKPDSKILRNAWKIGTWRKQGGFTLDRKKSYF